MKRIRLFTQVAITVALGLCAQAQDVLDVTRKTVTAEDLRATLGLDIYSFLLDLPEGEKYMVAVLTVAADGTEELRQVSPPFARLAGQPPSLRLALLPRPGPPGPALLSEAPELIIDISLTGCDRNGFATIIPNLMAAVPVTQKAVAIVSTRKKDRIHLVEVGAMGKNMVFQMAAGIVIAPVK